MKSIELLKLLQRINKPFYTIADLEKITNLPRSSLYVTLRRWVAGGIIERVAQGIYLTMGSLISVENVASQLYIPNYLSFESALAKHGILNLIPYALTFATSRKTRKYILKQQQVEFRQIASLDQLYFVGRGKTTIDFDELDIKKLSIKILRELAKRFPSYVQNRVKKMI